MPRLALALSLWLVACSHQQQEPAPAPATPPALVQHAFRPGDLDPAANRWNEEQFAHVHPGVASAGRLVVFLAGANSRPSSGRDMMKELAAMGFHTLAPAYANDYGIGVCAPDKESDDDCHRKVRLEAFEGVDHSPHIEVTAANSAERRVLRLLQRLAGDAPNEGWGAFLGQNQPRWDRIIVSGHSHGASSAGLVGKVRLVDRVVMLSGPRDSRAGVPAPWTRLPPVTPIDRFWGLSHTGEPQHQGHLADWEAMGLKGEVTSVDGASPPFGGSRRLVTSREPAGGNKAHGVTAPGGASPRGADGQYVLGPVWRHLFGR